jgi:hypothetical protein
MLAQPVLPAQPIGPDIGLPLKLSVLSPALDHGQDTRKLVWRHPSKKASRVQLDGTDQGQAAYTGGLFEPTIEAGASYPRRTEDSPHGDLPSLAKTVSVNDQFTYYIMFKPVTAKDCDAIWAPVAKATWFWGATAT